MAVNVLCAARCRAPLVRGRVSDLMTCRRGIIMRSRESMSGISAAHKSHLLTRMTEHVPLN